MSCMREEEEEEFTRRRRRRRRSLFRIIDARGRDGGRVYSESYTRGGAIPNEMGSAPCRATPALNQSADETSTPASWCLPVMPLPRRVTLMPRLCLWVVVRCFIESTLEHSQAPGAYVG
jgi:hypothetical protein